MAKKAADNSGLTAIACPAPSESPKDSRTSAGNQGGDTKDGITEKPSPVVRRNLQRSCSSIPKRSVARQMTDSLSVTPRP